MNKRAWGTAIQNREERFELKRRAVLLSAARLIRRNGFDKMSLADVAADLHVAKPTVYYYFRNKEEIVRELMEIAVARMLDPDDHPEDFPDLPGLSGARRFERFLRRCVRVIGDDVGACLFVMYPNQLPADARREIMMSGQPVVDWSNRFLSKGIEDGSIAPCDPLIVYHLVVNALRCVPELLESRQASVQKLTDNLVRLAMRGIATGL